MIRSLYITPSTHKGLKPKVSGRWNTGRLSITVDRVSLQGLQVRCLHAMFVRTGQPAAVMSDDEE